MARRKATRTLKQAIPTIIGEGITEQYYLTHLKGIKGYRYKVKPSFFGKTSFSNMAKCIDRILSNDGIAICFFDDDISRGNKQEHNNLDKLKSKYIDNKSVILCDSMPSIEFWFLIHYVDTCKYYKSSGDVIKDLSKHLKNYNKTAKYLENQDWVEKLCANDKLKNALSTAKKLDMSKESYTNVFKAFEYFTEHK